MKLLTQYFTYKPELFPDGEKVDISEFCRRYQMEGTEVFMEEFAPLEQPLFTGEAEKAALIERLQLLCVKRVHCSYWGYPTSFLTKNRFAELVGQIGGYANMTAYYGDLTGAHMFDRWAQEYEIATILGAQSYTFHLIDFSIIDGAWAFTISKEEIRQAMVYMTQQLLCTLQERGLLTENSPQIELENAGWGLEHGVQVANDYEMVFSQVDDPYHKLKIGWEINHLLHALGCDPITGEGRFFLPAEEISNEMAWLQKSFGHSPEKLAIEWISCNLLAPGLQGKIGSLHLSDCAMKTVEYFRNGILCTPFIDKLWALEDLEDRINYGWQYVLDYYDTHIPLGEGIVPQEGMRNLLWKLLEQNPDLVILHELKASKPLESDLVQQLDFLGIQEGQL